jgi:hypothetical protein
MTRSIPAAAILLLVLGVPATYAQSFVRTSGATFPVGSIEGRVLDATQNGIAGAMVSVVGRATAMATTDRDGHFALRELPYGPYIVSVHSRGYWRSRGRTVQLASTSTSVPDIHLDRVSSEKATVAPKPSTPTQLAGFGLDVVAQASAPATPATQQVETEAEESGETAWRLRHLPRSILKDAAARTVWSASEPEPSSWVGRSSVGLVPIAFFSELPLSGQVNLMTIESFDRPAQLFAANSSRSVAYMSVNTQAVGGAWAVQGAMTQGDLSSWIAAASYKSIASGRHAYELGLSYSTQRYAGGNVAALAAMRENARNVGAVYGYDEWTISPRLVLGYGAGYARYDYLTGSGLWSPRLSVTVPLNGFRVRAVASRRAVAPGAEEFAPSLTGMWLPPERTFSPLATNGRFTAQHTRHMQISIERDLAPGATVSLRAFGQHVEDQLVQMFGVDVNGRTDTPVGHYFVGTAGDVDARGWGAAMIQEVTSYVRGAIEYSVTTAYWTPSEGSFERRVRYSALPSSENVYDLLTSLEATIPQTATRVLAKYRVNTAFKNDDPDPLGRSNASARFNVRVNQSLPFLRFSNADWEMLVDVRNMFREAEAEASIYDEALAIRAPKRIVGGLLVKF